MKREKEEIQKGQEDGEKVNLPALYVNTLLTVETCGYFGAGHKRKYPTRNEPSKTIALPQNHSVKIIPTQEYGYPNSDDLDYKRAFDRICDEAAKIVERLNPDGTFTRHGHLSQPVVVPLKKLIRYAGRGVNSREVKTARDFLTRNGVTSIKGELQDPKTREYGSVLFSLFSQVITKGEVQKDGTESETNLVWLSPYALRCYYWRLTRKEDITFHHQLTKAISKVLYPYLDTGWFATHGKRYSKSYAALCELLSLPFYKYTARVRQQLDPTHKELNALGYLDRWEYREGATKNDIVIGWYPGQKWFEDLEARGVAFSPMLEAQNSTPSFPEPTPQPLPTAPPFAPEPYPTKDPRVALVVEDILAVLPEDEKSRHFYMKVARTLPDYEIHRILSEIKCDILENPHNTVRNPAAIFTIKAKEVAQKRGIAL